MHVDEKDVADTAISVSFYLHIDALTYELTLQFLDGHVLLCYFPLDAYFHSLFQLLS